MKRSGFLASVSLRAVAVAGLVMLFSMAPRPAAAQDQPDPLKFSATTPVLLINQIKAEKAADFEAAWAAMRAAFAKVEKADIKAFGETLGKMYKVDMPPSAAVIYIFHLETPSTTISYNPVKILYETIQANGGMTREEADAIYAKLKDAYQSINPWPLVKIG